MRQARRGGVGYVSDGDLALLMHRIAAQNGAHNTIVEMASAMGEVSAPYYAAWASYLAQWSEFYSDAIPINVLGYWPANEDDVATAKDFNQRLNQLLEQFEAETSIPTVPPAQTPPDTSFQDKVAEDTGATDVLQTAGLIALAGAAVFVVASAR